VNGTRRIGLIVPSSNTTIETEVPEMLRRIEDETFTFHSSRAVLHSVDPESLDRMVGELDRCGNELCDARVDAIVYACLVALMARGPGAHVESEGKLAEIVAERGTDAAVLSSAGALVRGLRALGLSRIAILTPYLKPLTAKVVEYLEAEGFTVTDAMSLEVSDNVAVAELDQARLPGLAAQLDLGDAQGVVISACVQMPSLAAIEPAEQRLGLPVLSAATATVYELLDGLGMPPVVPGAGALLAQRTSGGPSGNPLPPVATVAALRKR
jgi:maleate isomerase